MPRDPDDDAENGEFPPGFDLEQVFDQDYLHFYRDWSEPERCALEADLVAEALGLQEGDPVLDLGCGDGRIAVPLAEAGLRVTGIDGSTTMLDAAGKKAEAAGVEVAWRHGDLRELADEGAFAAAFSWFTAFGYHSDAEDQALLAQIHRALKPGGRLAIDHANRDFLLAHFEESRLYEEDDDVMLDRNRFDLVAGRMHTHRTVFRGGQRRDMKWQLRMFTVPELTAWLHAAGFRNVEAYGDELEPFDAEHTRLIVVAEK